MWSLDTWVGLATVIGVTATALATGYFASRRPPSGDGDGQPDHGYRQVFALAPADRDAIGGVGDELREIRGLMQRHLDLDKTELLVDAVKEIGSAVRAKSRAR